MFTLVLLWWQFDTGYGDFFHYDENNWNTFYPGQLIVNTIGYYEQRFPSTMPLTEVLDHFPGFYRGGRSKVDKLIKINETKHFERYLKTYFEPQAGMQADILQYKFSSLESNMQSAENRSLAIKKRLKQLRHAGGSSHELGEFWFLQYQKRTVRKLLRAFNSTDLQPYSKMLVPGVKLPGNLSSWVKSFDEIFDELKDGEPLVAPDLFKKQKAWWISNRKKICLFKINALRNYIKTVDNFFYQNREVLSVARWIKDRENLYTRKLSDLFWWLSRRDQYYREEYARLDYEKIWTPAQSTALPPGAATTFDYFRYNGDIHHLLRRRNKFYAKFFKRKKIGHFIKRLQALTTIPPAHQIYGYLFDQYKNLKNFPPDGENRSDLTRSKSKKTFCFQYFGKVMNVGIRSTIYNRIQHMYLGRIRGYIMYTHRGTVFGKICGDSVAVDEMKSFIKKLKTPTSKVTKLEFRGEGALHRYPKRLKRFHFYRGIFQRGLTDITQIMHEYNRMQAEENLREDDGRDVSDSGRVPDPLSAEVKEMFQKLADAQDLDNNKPRNKHNLKDEGLYI